MEFTTERTLTHLDFARLTRLVSQSGGMLAPPEGLQDLLAASDLVDSPEVAPDVVTMYTQLLADDGGPAPRKLTLCYPADAEPAQGFLSVLSPLGLALLGLRVGQVARWQLPGGGSGQARVLAVLFQPEASGDYAT